uniref:phage tail tube protein n=1 Tax=Arthrobacter silvisoli TaxID=2291022 RepID=UPI003F4961B5
MPKSLADGHKKVAILTTKPANPAAPTVAELTAGIDASCAIMFSDFTWSAADSDTVDEKALCDVGNATAYGASNWDGGFTLFRYFTSGGASDATADAAFQAAKVKGTTLYVYVRDTSKLSTDAWASADEIYLGGEVVTDTPQAGEGTGYIKRRIPVAFQKGYDNIAAAA